MDGIKELDWIARRKAGEQRTCLSYWFPKIRQAGLPVPRTNILRVGDQEARDLAGAVIDGEPLGSNGRT